MLIALLSLALLLLGMTTVSRGSVSTAYAAPGGVTYRAALSTEGDLLLTFTPDLSGVTRAEVREGLFEWLPQPDDPYEPEHLRFSHHLYYDPPQPVTAGRFEVTVADQLFGQSRDSVRIDGTITGGSIGGRAVLVACVYPSPCFDLASADWANASVIETPPGPNDTMYAGRIEGQSGTLTLSTNPDGNLTSFALDNVAAAGCLNPPLTLNIHTFFDPALRLSDGIDELLVAGGFVRLTSSVDIGGTSVSGTATVSYIYTPDCSVQLSWSPENLSTATPAPSATPPAARPVLPSSGSGGGSGSTAVPLALLTGLGTALAAAGVAVGRRKRRPER